MHLFCPHKGIAGDIISGNWRCVPGETFLIGVQDVLWRDLILVKICKWSLLDHLHLDLNKPFENNPCSESKNDTESMCILTTCDFIYICATNKPRQKEQQGKVIFTKLM